MKAEYYKVHITEMARNRPADGPEADRVFNTLSEEFKALEEVKAFLTDRYGKMPGMCRKEYLDTENGTEVVGFLHSFWNKDWSHNSKSWFQTDWVEVTSITEQPVLLTA